jgi:type III secretion inner rod protein HrpB2
MIAPVPPVSPVSPVAPAAPVAPAEAAPSAPPALVDRFAALMQQIGQGPAGQARTHGPSQLSRIVGAEDNAAKATLETVQSFSIGDMTSMPEAAAAVMHMQTDMAVLSFKLNVVNTLAESGKTAIQTLMKNQ